MIGRLAGPGAWILYAICLGTVVFILAPLCVVVAMSFSDSYFVQFPPHGFTLRWYAKILQEREFLEALRLSCLLSLSATLCSLALGVPTAFALTRGRFLGQGLLKSLVLSPLIFPTLVTGLSLMQLFARLGWEDARINLLIGHAVVTVPYVVRSVATSLLLVDRNLEDAALYARSQPAAHFPPRHPAANQRGHGGWLAVRLHGLIRQLPGDHVACRQCGTVRCRWCLCDNSSTYSTRRCRRCRRS